MTDFRNEGNFAVRLISSTDANVWLPNTGALKALAFAPSTYVS